MTTDIEFAAKACGANWKGDGQMITDERITELWNLASNTATSKPDWTYSEIIFATVRAVIAEHDAELRKQEPVAYTFKQEGSPAYTNNPSFMKLNTQYVYEPLYAAPIPPTPSQQEAMESLKTLTLWATTDRADLSAEVKQLRGFILARPDALTGWQPIETAPTDWGSYIVWHEKYGMETLFFQLKDGGLDGRKAGNWYSDDEDGDDNPKNWRVTHWMPLPARPDEVTK